MNIKQSNKTELEVLEKINENKSRKSYIKINSELGQKLIKEHNIVIDENMQDL